MNITQKILGKNTKRHYYYRLFSMGIHLLFREGFFSFWRRFKRWFNVQFRFKNTYSNTSNLNRRTHIRDLSPVFSSVLGNLSSKSNKFTLVTYTDVVNWTMDWIKSLDNSYDVIVGIPRSGLLVANLIALYFGKALSTPELLLQGKYWLSEKVGKKPNSLKRILLVDDSIASGISMLENISILEKNGDFDITTAALISIGDARNLVDLSYKVLFPPYNYEWSLTHQKGHGVNKIAMDLDGILCDDCPFSVDMDEDLYSEWISNVKPKFIPKYSIDVIITNRLAKYTDITTKWLIQNGIRYNHLNLWNIKTREQRGGIENWIQHKVDIISTEKPDLMYESDREQAERISQLSGIPTIWFEGKQVFQ